MASDRSANRDWRKAATASSAAGQPSKAPLFVAMLLAGILGGVLVGMWYWIKRDPGTRFISLPLYDLNNPAWPPVPYAIADGKRLMEYFSKDQSQIADDSREKERFDKLLKSLASFGDRPL